MKDIGFTMNDTGVKIGLIKITNSSAGFEIGKNTTKVEGKLGGLHIQDYDPDARYYPQMIEARTDEEMVIFTYETFDESKLKEGECGVLLLITFNHVKYIWIERFQLRIRQYFSEISAIQKYLSTTASSAAAAISKRSRLFRYDIQLRNPYIIIPRNTNTPDGLVIDLGEISISKQFPINEDGVLMTRICVNVKAMNWKSGNLKTQKHETFIPILTNTDLQMFWEKPYDEQKQQEHIYPGLNVWVHFPSLHLILSEYQCWQICSTIAENICAPPTDSENYVKKLKEKLKWYDTVSQLSNPPQLQPQPSMKSLKIKNPYADEEEEEDDFEFQPDDEKWTDLLIDFHLDKWITEVSKESGTDKEGNPTTIGALEVLNFHMNYNMFSNGSHFGLFSMLSMKLFDKRFHSENKFKELLTPLGPNIGKQIGRASCRERV